MKAAGFIIHFDTHLDHLGVLCELLDIPLIVSEEHLFNAAHTFYPHLQVELRSYTDVTSKSIMEEFDFLYFSSRLWAWESYVFAREFYKNDVRIIYCPHGNSDKGHSLIAHPDYPESDIELYYGEHMYDLLEKKGAVDKAQGAIRLGNFRYSYYKKHRTFYNALAHKHIFAHLDPLKETILYAPTRPSDECPTSFFQECGTLIEKLPDQYNLLIKLHPVLEKDFPVETLQLLGKHSDTPRVLFTENFPPIYPILEQCAFYIGDFSSIGYDYLAYDRPLFFFDPFDGKEKTRSHTLHACGLTLPSRENPFPFIEKNLEENKHELSAERQKMYAHTFGEPRDIATIKQDILNTHESSRISH